MADLLGALGDVAPALVDAARATLPSLGHNEWIPLDECIAFHELMYVELDEAERIEMYRKNLARSYAGAVFGPLKRAGAMLLGKRPEKHLRWVPSAWGIATRGLGKATFEGTDSGATLHILGVPAQALASIGLRESIRCSFMAVVADLQFDVSGGTSVVGDELVVELAWRAAASPVAKQIDPPRHRTA